MKPTLRRFAPWALVLISATIAVVAYLQAFNYPFVYDDDTHITLNTKLANLHFFELWRLLIEPFNEFHEFLPLRELSFWFDITLFGMNPAAFRIHNIVLYLLCLPLVYATTLRIWRYFCPADASAPWAAAVVTALFAIHPALVESVVWVSGRKYMLPNLFSMLALWFALNAKRPQGLAPAYATATLLAFVAVMLSKASYFPLAVIIAMLWVLFWRDTPLLDRRRVTLLWPLALLATAALMVLVFIGNSYGNLPFYWGIETVTRTLAVLGWLARLAVSPENRHLVYPMFEDPSFPVMAALGAVVMAAVAIGGVMVLRRRSLAGFALVSFFLLCLSYLQLAPVLVPTIISDRYLALAAWPVALMIVVLAWRLPTVPRVVLLLAIALPWMYQTIQRPHDWRSFEALVDTDLRAYPGDYTLTLYKLTTVLFPQGLYRDANELASKIVNPDCRNLMLDLVQASYIVHVKTAATGQPREAMAALWNLGIKLREPPVASKWDIQIAFLWSKAIDPLKANWTNLATHFPDDESVRYNAGLWLLGNTPYYEDAITHLRAAIESQRLPVAMRATAYKNLGFALLKADHIAEAEAPLRSALEQPLPDMRAYCLLADVYERTKRHEEATHAKANCPKPLQGKEELE